MEREIVIWLAGLLSTDGSVKNSHNSRGLAYCIYSSEIDWLQLIKNRLQNIGISCLIKPKRRKKMQNNAYGNKEGYFLWLHNPRKIALLFDKHSVKEFFNPRKWKLIEEGIKYYKNSANRSRYTFREIEIVKSNIHLSNKEIADLLKERDIQSVVHLKWRLGLKMPKETLSRIRREQYGKGEIK